MKKAAEIIGRIKKRLFRFWEQTACLTCGGEGEWFEGEYHHPCPYCNKTGYVNKGFYQKGPWRDMEPKKYKCPECGNKMTKLETSDVWICWESYKTQVQYHQYGSWYDPEPEEWEDE